MSCSPYGATCCSPSFTTATRSAQRDLDCAMHLSETIGMRPCLVRCLVQSGHLYGQENQPRRASEAFDRAEKLAQSIGMKL